MAATQDNSPSRPRRRDILRRRPWLSAVVLAGGAATYWLLCWPVVATRSISPVDPFWKFMLWLWPIPVLLSAICENRRWTRTWQLLLYALAVGYVCWITFHSSFDIWRFRPTFATCTQRTAVGGAVVFAAAWCLEQVAQYLLRFVRGFETQGRCQRCGYCILHLPEPRCPECGEPFDPEQPPGASTSRQAARLWRTQLVAASLILAGVIAPFAHKAVVLGVTAATGRAAAQNDWAAGCPVFYIDGNAAPWLTSNTYDVDTGMLVRHFGWGWKAKAFEEAYQAVTLRRLARYGPPPRRPDVLDREQIKDLLITDDFFQMTGQFQRLNNVFIVGWSLSVALDLRMRPRTSPALFMTGDFTGRVYYTAPNDATGVEYVLLEDSLLASFSPTDGQLQKVEIHDGEVADPPPIWPPSPAP